MGVARRPPLRPQARSEEVAARTVRAVRLSILIHRLAIPFTVTCLSLDPISRRLGPDRHAGGLAPPQPHRGCKFFRVSATGPAPALGWRHAQAGLARRRLGGGGGGRSRGGGGGGWVFDSGEEGECRRSRQGCGGGGDASVAGGGHRAAGGDGRWKNGNSMHVESMMRPVIPSQWPYT